MHCQFSIRVEPEHDLVRIELKGFFKVEDIARFATARNSAHLRLKCRRHQHLTLVDMREMQIQSQESVTAFQQLLAKPEHASKAIAFVVAQSLSRMQIQRAAQGRGAAYFTSIEEAEDWLLGRRSVAA